MADEFPTLEVALAALIPWLLLRGWLLGQSALRARKDLEQLAAAMESGEHLKATARSAEAAWLAPLWRVALLGGAGEPLSALEPLLTERSARLFRSLRSAAARDLVVCAVLSGALVYARSSLGVGTWFYGFGLANVALLVLAIGFRLRMARQLGKVSPRLLAALKARAEQRPSDGGGSRCRHCGALNLVRLTTTADLGAALVGLGVELLSICRKCGHVAGRARVVEG